MSTTQQSRFVCLQDFEIEALKILPKSVAEFFMGGANDEDTLKNDINAFQRWKIRPRILRNVSSISMSTSVVGQTIDFPVCIAPTGYHGLAHPQAEIGTSKGAASVNTIFTMSTHSTTSMEALHSQNPNALHFLQLYVFDVPQKLPLALQMIQIAAENGFKACVVTVDLPVLGERYCDMRNDFKLPLHLRLPAIDDIWKIKNRVYDKYDATLTWEDIKWLTEKSPLPFIVKGILTAEDALLAVECGVAGIVVSSHGGRQLDTVMATIDILPEVVSAVAGRCEVYMDGGIRHGTDVFKALALGARAVFIGRPVLYGLACNGADGVSQVLTILKNELRTAMALSGCASLKDIKPEMVIHQSRHWAKL